ncbi:pilus assembly protein PilZ [Methylobacterium sp. WL64]|uniref:PilZ domain-containing protein n=1 Tax=Methylobacterium sp. WL64 TaxID=2603894 RepID=UPI0011CA2623|nr:PilZ domain-containing protein [Methylobacterium sp. WL64]TXN01104.1 pilus assembly protein PilZ [Methylobacterium sp. WL64]
MIERKATTRHPMVVPALCLRRDGSEFHAVTVDISSEGLRLRSATLPTVEERLICNIRGIGAAQVSVVWVGNCDFTVRIFGKAPSPGEVARRFIELARRQAKLSDVVRVHKRIVPERTAVEVVLANGRRVPAQILNLSASGVALALDNPPAVGEVILVGRRQAMVARRIERGIGAAFLEPLDDTAISEHTAL